jgi:hypothetical protein
MQRGFEERGTKHKDALNVDRTENRVDLGSSKFEMSAGMKLLSEIVRFKKVALMVVS